MVHSKDLCPVLGEEATEEFIVRFTLQLSLQKEYTYIYMYSISSPSLLASQLPMFLRLCRDEVWGVRKTCADMFTNISQCCTLATKHDQLTPAFLKLLHDDSRWVRECVDVCA